MKKTPAVLFCIVAAAFLSGVVFYNSYIAETGVASHEVDHEINYENQDHGERIRNENGSLKPFTPQVLDQETLDQMAKEAELSAAESLSNREMESASSSSASLSDEEGFNPYGDDVNDEDTDSGESTMPPSMTADDFSDSDIKAAASNAFDQEYYSETHQQAYTPAKGSMKIIRSGTTISVTDTEFNATLAWGENDPRPSRMTVLMDVSTGNMEIMSVNISF